MCVAPVMRILDPREQRFELRPDLDRARGVALGPECPCQPREGEGLRGRVVAAPTELDRLVEQSPGMRHVVQVEECAVTRPGGPPRGQPIVAHALRQFAVERLQAMQLVELGRVVEREGPVEDQLEQKAVARSGIDVDFLPGEQLISVVRKGTRAVQQLPASADAFVWHRLYQQELLRARVPGGRRQPAWWTLRRPYRPLSYHGAHRMFERVNASLGADWTLHDLRHSAASRMARDSELSLTDVQWVMGHAHLATTEIYLTPTRDEVIEGVLAHHARQSRVQEAPPPQPAPGYDPQSLSVLFGRPS